MAHFTKEEYQGKAEWAARRMAENAKVDSLTEEQHTALAELCQIRHWIHSTDRMSLFNEESVDSAQMYDYFAKIFDDGLLESVGLPKLCSIDWTSLASNSDWYNILQEDERAEYNDDYEIWLQDGGYFDEFCQQMEQFNGDVEKYLAEIDKKHGTNYCPSGASRIF